MSSQRQRQSRWRTCFVLLMFLGLIGNGELTSVSSTTTSPFKRKSQNPFGSLSDITWHAWTVMLSDQQADIQPGMDVYSGPNLVRRITPKSVFIAPALPACAEGYRADAMGRCVKSVNIDENAHINFLLERLNALYANQDAAASQTSENDEKTPSGPLQLNIPLIPDSDAQSAKIDLEHAFLVNDPILIMSSAHDDKTTDDDDDDDDDDNDDDEPENVDDETTMTADGMTRNGTILEKTEFPLGENSSDVDDVPGRKTGVTVVSLAEFINETANDTDSSEIVDYGIPIDLKTMSINTSSAKGLGAGDATRGDIPAEKQWDNVTEMSPTLILLLSPTKLPSVDATPLRITINDNVTTLASTQPHNVSTADRVAAMSSDPISNATIGDRRTAVDEAADSMHPSAKGSRIQVLQSIAAVDDEHTRNNEAHVTERSTTAKSPSSSKESPDSKETEFYDEEAGDTDYTYSTDVPEEEDSTEMEGEEILKHGETAGMTLPMRNVEHRSHRDQQQRPNETATEQKTVRDHQPMIRLNDSALAEDKDDETADSNVSSEVSIDGDLILETTLLDVNTESLPITTRPPDVTARRVVENSGEDDLEEETFDESPISEAPEPEIAFSPDAHDGSDLAEDKPNIAEHVTRAASELEEIEDLETAPSSAELSSRRVSGEDRPEDGRPKFEIRTEIDEERSSAEDGLPRESSEKVENLYVPAAVQQQQQRSTIKLDTTGNDYASVAGGYSSRFPSSEANSIHSPSYKQHSLYSSSDDLGSYSSTSTKSSVPPVHQKPVYYLAAPSWKPDRPQSDRVSASASERQKQSPMLLRFWSKMPLVRDPAIYPVDRIPDSESNHPDDVRKQRRDRFHRMLSSRRTDLYTESAPRNINRLLTQKRGTPIHG